MTCHVSPLTDCFWRPAQVIAVRHLGHPHVSAHLTPADKRPVTVSPVRSGRAGKRRLMRWHCSRVRSIQEPCFPCPPPTQACVRPAALLFFFFFSPCPALPCQQSVRPSCTRPCNHHHPRCPSSQSACSTPCKSGKAWIQRQVCQRTLANQSSMLPTSPHPLPTANQPPSCSRQPMQFRLRLAAGERGGTRGNGLSRAPLSRTKYTSSHILIVGPPQGS
jgi:hypothetical protein